MIAHRFPVRHLQQAALSIYVLDPAVVDVDGPFPGGLVDGILVVNVGGRLEAFERVTEGANSADASGDRQLCAALSKLASRILRVTP